MVAFFIPLFSRRREGPSSALDPRWFQIVTLSSLLVYGKFALDFSVSWLQVAATITAAILTQAAWTKAVRLPRFEPKSALISALSLTLLLKTSGDYGVALAAAVAVSSKFVLRFRGKHVFNPANFAIVLALITGEGWVTPSQWGNVALFALALGGIGAFVTARSARSDVTVAFLVFYAAAVVGRSIGLGDPLSIPLHNLQSGALVLFAFFMISDPKTTPNSRVGRIVFAAAIAALTYVIQFYYYRSDAIMWALAAVALATPLVDVVLPARKFEWNQRGAEVEAPSMSGGKKHAMA